MVQPHFQGKITHKRNKRFHRFQSDRFKRVKVHFLVFIIIIPHGESPVVLITRSAVASAPLF